MMFHIAVYSINYFVCWMHLIPLLGTNSTSFSPGNNRDTIANIKIFPAII